MNIKVRSEDCVYLTFNPNTEQEKTLYVDNSTNELIIDAWKGKHKLIKPTEISVGTHLRKGIYLT